MRAACMLTETFLRVSAGVVLSMLLCAGLCGGCTRSLAHLDDVEQRDVAMVRARAKEKGGDVDAAIRIYQGLLDQQPRMARAHLDLALLQHDRRHDHMRAIYHYERYLELRPDTEKADMIRNRIRMAKQSFAANALVPKGAESSMTRTPEHDRAEAEAASLRESNVQLKEEMGRLKEEIARLRAELAHRSAVSGSGSGVPRTYRVLRGDTLSSIAGAIYNDAGKWRGIAEANRSILGNADKVQEGQLLVIP